ncbi:hypothetical protein Tco_1060345 [Tanacetum coccineum]
MNRPANNITSRLIRVWDETKKSYYTESLRVAMKLLEVVSVLLALPSADEAELKEYRKNYQRIVFHGTSILYKTVQKRETSKEE